MSAPPAPKSASAASSPRTNRLAGESSPYLLQHATNPVDWRPWNREAHEEARTRGVPIFLSVGYSTCHWCHVMERESFQSEAIAREMNELFVCIKVDREERPDLDEVYMTALQLMTGRGGWPMSAFLTPPGARAADDAGLECFYAGTYFPAQPRHGMPAFPAVLRNISAAWNTQREDVLAQAAQVTDAVREHLASARRPVALSERTVGQALASLLRLHDAQRGGFGPAPKFPQPVYLEFLLEAIPALSDPAARATAQRALRTTLDAMALGGIHDHVAGGFHRYSVDDRWLVPHFEKMLYDNAQLLSVYARAFARDRDAFDERVIRSTAAYVLREMALPDGAFSSAQDADVNHREGLTYLWTRQQLDEALGPADGARAAELLGVDQGPNFQDPHHPEDPPSNVLFLRARPDELARLEGKEPAQLTRELEDLAARLLIVRARRDQPATDDKVITAWNGLMITGLARAAEALREPAFLESARRAASALHASMRSEGGGLLRAARAGVAKTPAFLEDYAMLIEGLLALRRAEVALDAPLGTALEHARQLLTAAQQRFEDPAVPGRFHDTLAGQQDLIVRTRSTHDGAMPSGSSALLHALIDFYELTGERPFLEKARDMLAQLSPAVAASPVGSINSTRALLRLLRTDAALVSSIAPPDEPDSVTVEESPVVVFASAERLTISEAVPGTLNLELRIAPGFHIAAHEPGMPGLTGLSLEVREGSGVDVSVDYPPGDPYSGAALPPEEQGRLLVHTGTLRLDVTLRRSGAWTGRPLLVIAFQPCDDAACYQPMTLELDVALDAE
ncbi:MAG: DUF255 domain-containing protein [Planctomycetota bacterium]|nr:DUF255 domain-containing protein [Planctomycetota bacterium]